MSVQQHEIDEARAMLCSYRRSEMKNLYELTGNVCDINTLLINKAELDARLKQCRDAALDEAADALMKSDLSGLNEDRYLQNYTAQLALSWATFFRTLK